MRQVSQVVLFSRLGRFATYTIPWSHKSDSTEVEQLATMEYELGKWIRETFHDGYEAW